MNKIYLFVHFFCVSLLFAKSMLCDIQIIITKIANYCQLFVEVLGFDKVIKKQAATATQMLVIKSKCSATFKEKQIAEKMKWNLEYRSRTVANPLQDKFF